MIITTKLQDEINMIFTSFLDDEHGSYATIRSHPNQQDYSHILQIVVNNMFLNFDKLKKLDKLVDVRSIELDNGYYVINASLYHQEEEDT